MKLPAGPSGALDDDDAASLEASLLEDVALDDETQTANPGQSSLRTTSEATLQRTPVIAR